MYSTVFKKQKQKPFFFVTNATRALTHSLYISLSHTNLLSCFVTHQIQQMHQQPGPRPPWKGRLLGRAQTHLGHHRQKQPQHTHTTQNTESQHTNGHMDVTKKRWVSRWNEGKQKMRGQHQENQRIQEICNPVT